ncbi:hypothetical protein MT356_12920 [Rathayibacter festucae]|uniref:hypothetical protein n=1 Tax=Rathayibacter festucae TaxID=110937 RepID=UPI001FB1B7AC|nr:hypothetical protein [Rathayibacter festucae]MCJ1700622.1 hypothetical protein [Rathayibacter festucae]
MTPDQQHPQGDERHSSHPSGVVRRTAVAAAWTIPVIATAVAAPAAAASVRPGDDVFLGVFLGDVDQNRFNVSAFVNGIVPDGAPIVLGEVGRVDIESEHDVVWDPDLVSDGPRHASFLIPAGPYPGDQTYRWRGREVTLAELPLRRNTLSPTPTGTFGVTATLTLGPSRPGTGAYGRSVVSISVRV